MNQRARANERSFRQPRFASICRHIPRQLAASHCSATSNQAAAIRKKIDHSRSVLAVSAQPKCSSASIGVVNITHDNSISLLWEPASFPSSTCAGCQALHQVVKGEAGPQASTARQRAASAVSRSPGCEDNFVLQYFLYIGPRCKLSLHRQHSQPAGVAGYGGFVPRAEALGAPFAGGFLFLITY